MEEGRKKKRGQGGKNLSQVVGSDSGIMNLQGRKNMYFKYSAIVTSLISRPPPCLVPRSLPTQIEEVKSGNECE